MIPEYLEPEAKTAALTCAITVARYLGYEEVAEYLQTETNVTASISEETVREAAAAICLQNPDEALRLIHDDLMDSSHEIDHRYARYLREQFPALDLERGEGGAETYVILYRGLRPSDNQVWDGTGWTAEKTEAARYAPGEFPDTIESLQGLYDLEIGTQYDGVPEEYAPPEDYWEEWERAFPQDTKDYQEPGEWLADEYRDSLYIVIPTCDLDERMEE